MNSKRIWLSACASLIFALGLHIHAAHAVDWSIASFRSDISIHSDASITVAEHVQANFNVGKHGIIRTIPFEYQTDQGQTVSVPISILQVLRNGHQEPYHVVTQGTQLQLKIGDKNATLTGRQDYDIKYSALAAVNFFEDHDELYWNVTGNTWDVPMRHVQAVVRLDDRAPVNSLQAACYTGRVGSTAKECTATPGESSATFVSEDYLTVVFGWAKGVVTKPDNYDELRSQGANGYHVPSVPAWGLWTLNLGLPIAVFLLLLRHWMMHGRDPKFRGTIIAQYEPPPDLTPGELGTLVEERAQQPHVVATIVDLAVRGYLTITEVQTAGAWGFGKNTDYRLDQKSQDTGKLREHEVTILNGLFSSRQSVLLSDLKGTFYTTVTHAKTELYRVVRTGGYFFNNPNTVRTVYIMIGIAIMVLTAGGFALGIFGTFIVGALVTAFGPFMPQRTAKGAEALWYAKGFKLFLEKAEKYRLQWQEKQHIFEQLLPYAMVLGVAEQWSKTFEGIQQAPPNWYSGAPGSNFNSLLLWSSLNSFSATTTRSFAPPAASGSSGFGGGGFSGGGFGGGGGGSW